MIPCQKRALKKRISGEGAGTLVQLYAPVPNPQLSIFSSLCCAGAAVLREGLKLGQAGILATAGRARDTVMAQAGEFTRLAQAASSRVAHGL